MFVLLLAASIQFSDTSAVTPTGPVRRAIPAPSDTVRRRHAVELSDAYYTRLTIHRWASYAELPLFGAEYLVGDKLMSRGTPVAGWVKPTHVGLATAIGGLFAINTVTGGWNLYEGWSQLGNKKALVVTHTALMLLADGGFAGASLIAGNGKGIDTQRRHRAVAVASMSAATVSTVMMWIAKRR